MKKCQTCCVEKPLTEFHRQAKAKDGVRSQCRTCVSAYYAAYAVANQDRLKGVRRRYDENHRDANNERHRLHRKLNPTKDYDAAYRASHKKECSARREVTKMVRRYFNSGGHLVEFRICYNGTDARKEKHDGNNLRELRL